MDQLQQILSDIEARREQDALPALEKQLSVNEWINRLKSAAAVAHGAARAGSVEAEYSTWVDIAAIAVGRLEQLSEIRS